MSVPQQSGTPSQAPQARTLSGALAKTPAPRLLTSASAARVTGTLGLTCTETGETATLVFVRGAVTKVKTSAPVAYLGSVLYELGYIDSETLNQTLRELSRVKWLHGEILLTRAAVTGAQLAEGLHEQTTRKLVHLFTLPATTTYAFEADVDHLASWGGADWPHVDPAIAVWRGVRDGFAEEEVNAGLLREATRAYRLASGANPKRFDFTADEVRAVECMRARALTLDELVRTASLDPKRTRALVYFLMVTKQAESLDTSGVRPAFRPESVASGPSEPNRKPTVPQMPAVGSPRISSIPRGPSESGRWMAVGSRHSSSARVPVASPAPAESASMPVARSMTPGAISLPPDSTRMRMARAMTPAMAFPVPGQAIAKVEPSAAPRRLSPPPLPVDSAWADLTELPPAGDRGARRSSSPPQRHLSSPPIPTDFPKRPSTGTFNAKVVAELAGRRQSIADRAQAILREDYFQRLSLTRDAKPAQVEQAFTALKTLWDPELLPPALVDAKDDCTFVMSCLVEAYTALRDPRVRDEYVQRITTAALRGQTDQYAEDVVASGKDDPAEGAAVCFGRGELERAERLARRAVKANPDAAEALALLAWLEASKPANASLDETRKRIVMLDRALRLNETLSQALYWRGMLHKRIENHNAAVSSFRKVVELNPKHMDAVRELRVYEMRIRRNSISMKAVR